MITQDRPLKEHLYSLKSIGIATFLGAPIAGSILIRHNFLVLNEEDKAKNALIIGIASTVLIFVGIFLLPQSIIDKIPNSVIPLTYSLATRYIVENIQGEAIELHENNQKPFASGWKAVAIGLVCGVIIGAIVVGYSFLTSYDPAIEAYEQKMETFVANEADALSLFENNTYDDYLIIRQIENQTIPKWQKNLGIVSSIAQIEDLSPELITRNNAVKRYCELRIKEAELLKRSILDYKEEYRFEIQRIRIEIEDLITQDLQ